MIHVADSGADFERCAEIYDAVEPDRGVREGAGVLGRGSIWRLYETATWSR
jgi:hypothetical protein